MPIPSTPEVQSLPAEILIAGEDLLDSLVDIETRPHLMDMLNLSQLVAMPGHIWAVGVATRIVSGKVSGKARQLGIGTRRIEGVAKRCRGVEEERER